MSMKRITWLDLLMWVLFAMGLAFMSASVWADTPDVIQSNDPVTTQSVETSVGDQIVKGDSSHAFGLSNALGDVDIADYVISKQKGNAFWAWQNYDYNLWAMADRADLGGKHDEAATLRCMVEPVAEAFPDNCVTSMTFTFAEPPSPETDPKETDEDEDRYLAQAEEIAYVREELAAVTKRLTGRPQVTTIQQPYLSDDKKARLREAIK